MTATATALDCDCDWTVTATALRRTAYLLGVQSVFDVRQPHLRLNTVPLYSSTIQPRLRLTTVPHCTAAAVYELTNGPLRHTRSRNYRKADLTDHSLVTVTAQRNECRSFLFPN